MKRRAESRVDPSSTLQGVNALIKAHKKFDLFFVPGGGHGADGAYGQRLMQDLFAHHLLGAEPPDWKRVQQPKKRSEIDDVFVLGHSAHKQCAQMNISNEFCLTFRSGGGNFRVKIGFGIQILVG